MSEEQVKITTGDGECPAWVFTPDGGGTHPGAILYMDAIGIRPALIDMGRRLAQHGYVVLMPDLFYRAGPYEVLDPKTAFADDAGRAKLMALMGTTDNLRAAKDTRAFLDYLESRPDVAHAPVGLTGYCMGGAVALTAAGTYPDEVGAVGAFHTARVITDTEQSPSRAIPNITGRVYVGASDNDPGYPPEMAAELEKMLTDAGIEHHLEVYQGALHGYTMTDFPVYNEEAAERHWRELFNLFDESLKQPA